MGNKPYVQPYVQALPQFRQKTGHSKYMQMRLSLPGWETLLPDLAPLPPEFWTEAELKLKRKVAQQAVESHNRPLIGKKEEISTDE